MRHFRGAFRWGISVRQFPKRIDCRSDWFIAPCRLTNTISLVYVTKEYTTRICHKCFLITLSIIISNHLTHMIKLVRRLTYHIPLGIMTNVTPSASVYISSASPIDSFNSLISISDLVWFCTHIHYLKNFILFNENNVPVRQLPVNMCYWSKIRFQKWCKRNIAAIAKCDKRHR